MIVPKHSSTKIRAVTAVEGRSRVSPERRREVGLQTELIMEAGVRRKQKTLEKLLQKRSETLKQRTSERERMKRHWQMKTQKSPFAADLWEENGPFIALWDQQILDYLETAKLEEIESKKMAKTSTVEASSASESYEDVVGYSDFDRPRTNQTSKRVSKSSSCPSLEHVYSKTNDKIFSPTKANNFDKFPDINTRSHSDNIKEVRVGSRKVAYDPPSTSSAKNREVSSAQLFKASTRSIASPHLLLEPQPEFVYAGIEPHPFHTEIVSKLFPNQIVLSLFRAVAIQPIQQRTFDPLNILKPTAPDRMLVKVYDPVTSREASTVINLRELTLHLYDLREKYSPTAADHYKPGETWWWAENIKSLLLIRTKPRTGMVSVSVSKQAVEKIVVDGLSLATQSEDASPDPPTSDEAAQTEALTMIPVHSELVEDIYNVPVILSLLSSGDIGVDNRFDVVKYDPSKHYPSVRPPPTRLTLKVVDLVASAEASCHLNFEDLANFLYHLREKYSLRAVQFFHPISVDWWVQNARKVVDVSKKTARDGTVTMSVSISKRAIELLVAEGLEVAAEFTDTLDDRLDSGGVVTVLENNPNDVDAVIERMVKNESAALAVECAALLALDVGATSTRQNLEHSISASPTRDDATALSPRLENRLADQWDLQSFGVVHPASAGPHSTGDVSPLSSCTASIRFEDDDCSIDDSSSMTSTWDNKSSASTSTMTLISDDSSSTQIIGLEPVKRRMKKKMTPSEETAWELIQRGRSLVNPSPKYTRRKLTAVEKRLMKSPFAKNAVQHIITKDPLHGRTLHQLEVLDEKMVHNEISPTGTYALSADAISRRDGLFIHSHNAAHGHEDLIYGGKAASSLYDPSHDHRHAHHEHQHQHQHHTTSDRQHEHSHGHSHAHSHAHSQGHIDGNKSQNDRAHDGHEQLQSHNSHNSHNSHQLAPESDLHFHDSKEIRSQGREEDSHDQHLQLPPEKPSSA